MTKSGHGSNIPHALSLLLAMWMAGCQSTPTRVDPDLELLQGHWECEGPGGPCAITITGDVLLFRARPDFWYDTKFILYTGAEPRQLHATIVKDSTEEPRDIGRVVVAIFKFEGEKLTLGVIDDYDELPSEPVDASWDGYFDRYHLERAQPPADP